MDDWFAVEAYKAGKDFHEATAIRIHDTMGWDYHTPLNDAERQIGKTSNFAAIYSGGIPTIQRQLKCDKQVARRIADAFHADYPGLGRWKWEGRGFTDPDPESLNGQICSRLRERGYITTLWGRHLHPLEDRAALNALIQGGAADLMKQGMVNIARNIKDLKSHMILSVHDEIGFDCVEEELPFLLENTRTWMSDPRLEEVLPIEVDFKVSRTSWAEAEEVVLARD